MGATRFCEIIIKGAGRMEKNFLISHEDLEVYQMAFDVAMKIFEMSKKFPVEMNIHLVINLY